MRVELRSSCPRLPAPVSRMVPLLGALLLVGSLPAHGAGQTLSRREALRLAFPEPTVIERRTASLSTEELGRAEGLAGSALDTEPGEVSYHVGLRDGKIVGYAYFDRHRVRTLHEVVMVVVTPEGSVRGVEVLRFSEPPKYRAPERWLRQFAGEELGDGLSLRGDVAALTGATLTARALTRSVRKILALHRVIVERAGGAP